MSGRLTAIDARMYWLSRRIPNDQFLLYAFDGETSDPPSTISTLLRRAQTIERLAVRLRETPLTLDYPYWVPTAVTGDHAHISTRCTWEECLDRVAASFADQVDPRRTPWMVHLYPDVGSVPGSTGPSTVVVLQVSHALADGGGASALARELFADNVVRLSGHPTLPDWVAALRGVVELPTRTAATIVRAHRAIRSADRRDADTRSGAIPSAPPDRTPTPLSRPPGGRPLVRCVVCEPGALRNDRVSVTVAALVVVSVAMSEQLASMGVDIPNDLGAEVTMAIPPELRTTMAHNAFHNAGVDLHPAVHDLRVRATAIETSLRERRRRLAHEAFGAGDRVTEMLPARIVRRDVDRVDVAARPGTVSGHTVVSSVNRGAADVAVDGHRVLMTAGFPALSPAMGITHGVHGIGDVVTVSIVTSEATLPDVDAYVDRVRTAVDRVRKALR